jgi:iron complex outermembrane recepter protein
MSKTSRLPHSPSRRHLGSVLKPAAVAVLTTLLCAAGAHARGLDYDQLGDVDDLRLEDLANIKVTSVSKRAELLTDAPASIFVITGDDIRRAGATTLPEALRLAPNLQVAGVDARNYAITARGFNNAFENKLLVLIDGRVVYSPLFSGVYWDAQDVVLEDIDRIEVISGPGATMWGANAVNGVVNVITKRADQTQGTLAAVDGSRDRASGSVRYGGLSHGGSYRAYAKTARSDDLPRADGKEVLTGWHRNQAGFRADWGDTLQQSTVQGDAYQGALHQAGTVDIKIGGANLLGRMTRQTSAGAELSLQAYWDYTERNQPNAFIEHLNTVDLQLQHATKTGANQLLVGAGYRMASDHVQNDRAFAFLPGSRNMTWANVFVQDELALRENLRLTGGLKLEHNSYTGFEVLPTLRLAYKPTSEQLLWGALSRSVRAPSRIDRDFYSPTTPPLVNGVPHYTFAGGPDFESEIANVAELGYRAQLTPSLTWSATAFYSRYDRLRTGEMDSRGSIVFRNSGEGRSRGIETWGTWQAAAAWRLSAGLVAQRVTTDVKPGVTDLLSKTGLATSDPSNHWLLRSSFDVREGQELDLTLRHSGSLASPAVPAYTALDLRYGWRLAKGLELSLIGQNLLDHAHPEYGSAPNRTVFERALAVKLVWQH